MIPRLKDIFSSSFKEIAYSHPPLSLPESALNNIYEHTLFKLFLPSALGGCGLSMEETLGIIKECASIDGSLGWAIQIGNGGNYFASCIASPLCEALFSPPKAVLAGSGTPSGIIRRREGKTTVSGKWKYCSGADYASFFTISCKVEDTKETAAVVLFRKEVTIHPDWVALGLTQTSTHTIEARDVLIENERIFYPIEQKGAYQAPIFRIPFIGFAQLFILFPIYGLCDRLVEESGALLSKKKNEWENTYGSGRVENIEHLLEQISLYTNRSESDMLCLVRDILAAPSTKRQFIASQWEKKIKEQKADIMRLVHRLFPLLGMDVLYLSHPICRVYLDLIANGQHSLLNDYGAA